MSLGPAPQKAIRAVGPITYVHRPGCTADPGGYPATSTDGRIWRCRACGVRVGIDLRGAR